MKRAISCLCLSTILAACGAAQERPVANGAAQGGEATSTSLNIPDTAWTRAEIDEAGITVELPSPAGRRVSTREDGQTVQYLSLNEPLLVMVAVEFLPSVVTPAQESEVLDRLAQLFVQRASDPQRGCMTAPVETITQAGHAGRIVAATGCRSFRNGGMMTMGFLHGRAVVSTVVSGEGVPLTQLEPVMRRVRESVQFGEAPSWFLPVDTRIEPPHTPGLSFEMPSQVETEIVEEDGQIHAEYISEPISGLGVRVNVTTPAELPLAEYCRALMGSQNLAMIERRDAVHTALGVPYCEVRGRWASNPGMLEMHNVFVISGTVLELVWVGPFAPSFVAGGEAQLDAMRASIRTP